MPATRWSHLSWPRLNAEHAGEHRRLDRSRTNKPGEVEHRLLGEVDPRGLVGSVETRHHQAGRDQDQHEASDLEEAAQVDADSPAIQSVAEHGGDQDAGAAPRLASSAFWLAWTSRAETRPFRAPPAGQP